MTTETLNAKSITFDHVRFMQSIDVIAEHQGLDSQNKLAAAIGVDAGVLYRIRRGEGVTFESLVTVIHWANLDLRRYIAENESVRCKASVKHGTDAPLILG